MAEACGSARPRALARLVPPLVHRLNNLLAVVSGRCDVWAGRGAPGERFLEQVGQISAASVETVRLLRALSLFAGERAEVSHDLAPEQVLAAVEALAAPLARETGTVLAVETRGGAAVLEGDLRRFVQALGTVLIAALDGEGGDPARRARLVASVTSGPRARVAFTVVGSHPVAPAGESEGAAGPLEELGREPRARVRRRALRGASAWRLVLPARVLDSPAAEPDRRDAGRRRVVVVVLDELLSDLVASVLDEEGYRVSVAEPGRELVLGPNDVLLVDADDVEPALARDLLARAGRAVVLGGPEGDLGRAVGLAKPFRPGALLDAVRAASG